MRHLPPLYTDILWLPLALIERPTAQMQCQLCILGFSSRLRQDAAAWRIHGCGHYIHAVCLRNFGVQTTAEPNGGCRTCESLRCQLQSIPERRKGRPRLHALSKHCSLRNTTSVNERRLFSVSIFSVFSTRNVTGGSECLGRLYLMLPQGCICYSMTLDMTFQCKW